MANSALSDENKLTVLRDSLPNSGQHFLLSDGQHQGSNNSNGQDLYTGPDSLKPLVQAIQDMEKHLQEWRKDKREKQLQKKIEGLWKAISVIWDKFFFWLFVFILIFTTIVIFGIVPLFKVHPDLTIIED